MPKYVTAEDPTAWKSPTGIQPSKPKQPNEQPQNGMVPPPPKTGYDSYQRAEAYSDAKNAKVQPFNVWTPQEDYGGGLGAAYGLTDYGAKVSAAGVSTLQDAAAKSAQDRVVAMDYSQMGYGIGGSGIAGQDGQIAEMVRRAEMRGPSVAQAQLQQGLAQTQQAMLGQAAQARGGSQAAAMRNAQMAGSNMALQTNQQAAIMRAQEEQMRQQNIIDARATAAKMYGDRAGLGYGMAGEGMGYAGAATGRIGDVGARVGGIGAEYARTGVAAQGTYVDAIQDAYRVERGMDANAENRRWQNVWNAVAAGGAGIGGIGQGFASTQKSGG